MSVWDLYGNRTETRGKDKKEIMRIREERFINRHISDSLSYHSVTIDNIDRDVAIIASDNLNEKTILSLPGEDLIHGGLVHWMDNYWLITERDADTTLYTRAKMIQCNHLLKWVSDDDVIHEQWCIIEDGTKYLTGELEDRNFIVTRGDSRIAMTIARNEYTVKFNRENRFLIDDPDSEIKLAYQLTKPLKLGASFNEQGVFKFVLQEVTGTSDDNNELGIADYYKHFPQKDTNDSDKTDNNSGKKVWL